jgi:hypothetical protein
MMFTLKKILNGLGVAMRREKYGDTRRDETYVVTLFQCS